MVDCAAQEPDREGLTMLPDKSKELLAEEYERYAQEFARGMLPEDFAETAAQAIQREITLASLALVRAHRQHFHLFNEPLIKYRLRGSRDREQVVPDNMVAVCRDCLKMADSFNVSGKDVRPFWVLDYVSARKKRKDYEDNFDKYEDELKVPYCLIFEADGRGLTLYHHDGKNYVSVPPNEHGRYPVPEVKIEVALLDGWVRFWYEGELLPLPEELQRDLDEVKHRLAEEKKARRAAEDEVVRLRRLLEQRDKNG
jgi:Uma2 family endonuclease